MATTNITIARRACVLARIEPISSFADGTVEAVTLEEMYEPTVLAELAAHHWRFSSTYYDLTGNASASAPLARWATAFNKPATVIKPWSLHLPGQDEPIPFALEGRFILCDLSEDDSPILYATYRQNEAEWEHNFSQCIVYRLAALLCNSVTSRQDKADSYTIMADSMRGDSRFLDATSGTAGKFSLGKLRNRRKSKHSWRN